MGFSSGDRRGGYRRVLWNLSRVFEGAAGSGGDGTRQMVERNAARVYLDALVTANIIGARAQDFDVRSGESDAVLADSSYAGISAFGSKNVNDAWATWFRAACAAERAHGVNRSHDSQMAKGNPPEPTVAGIKSKLNDSLMPAEIHAREALVKTIRDELAVDGNDKLPRLGRWKRLRSRFTHL